VAASIVCACSDPAGLGDLVRTLRVQPDTVAAGDTFRVTVTIRNPTHQMITLRTSSTCAVVLHVQRHGERQAFSGTDYACGQAMSFFPIARGDSLVREFQLLAMLQDTLTPPFGYTVPPPAGQYTLRAVTGTELLDLEAPLVLAPRTPPPIMRGPAP
jgi:hypothetical protein